MIIIHCYLIITHGIIITHYYPFQTDKLADVAHPDFPDADVIPLTYLKLSNVVTIVLAQFHHGGNVCDLPGNLGT